MLNAPPRLAEWEAPSSQDPLVSAFLDSPPEDFREWGSKAVAIPGLLKSLSSLSDAQAPSSGKSPTPDLEAHREDVVLAERVA